MLGGLAQDFLAAHGGLVELHALVAVTLGDLLAPHEDPGPDALRAGVAAPDATSEYGDEEQAEGADDQQPGEQDEILGPEGSAEDVELALGEVPPDGLAIAPVEPDGAEIKQEEEGAAGHPQVAEQAGEGSGVDFFAAGVQVGGCTALGRGRGDVLDGNLFAHRSHTTAVSGALTSTVPVESL
ncbi:hypothetical protein D9M71_411240 [compost metagenome]